MLKQYIYSGEFMCSQVSDCIWNSKCRCFSVEIFFLKVILGISKQKKSLTQTMCAPIHVYIYI